MRLPFLAIFSALASYFLLALIPFLGWWGAILPALLVGVIVYILMLRRFNNKLQPLMKEAQQAQMQGKPEQAVQLLLQARETYGPWLPMMTSQLNGNIGALYYMLKKDKEAKPYLEKAFIQQWEPQLMLAILTSKKNDGLKQADELLEKTVRFTNKHGLLWSTWAYLHWKVGNTSKALELLHRGKSYLGDKDDNITKNILALQNDKKMKMSGYGEMWYAMGLEEHPMLLQQRRGGVRYK